VITVIEEHVPTPKAGEVRVKVLAAGVSLPDILAREGVHPETPRVPYPPGWDLVEPSINSVFRVVAERQHVVEILARELIHMFRAVRRMSMPTSLMTAIASGRTVLGFVPALSTAKRSPASRRSRPSAIWDRAEFPVHRMSTLFLICHAKVPSLSA
jgi:hypothetical protein